MLRYRGGKMKAATANKPVHAKILTAIVLLVFHAALLGANAFAPSKNVGLGVISSPVTSMLYESRGNDEQSPNTIARREIIKNAVSAIFVIPTLASAENLPSSNGADLSQTGSIDTLIPVVAIQKGISSAKLQLEGSNKDSSSIVSPDTCATILQSLLKSGVPREEKAFKRIFDAYSTPVSYKQKFLDQNAFLVYYTKGYDGPGRPNIEEDTNNIQTLQYGSRNDAWAAMDDLFVELEFGQKSKSDDSSLSSQGELVALVEKALMALDSYLSLLPAEDVKEANHRLG